MKIASNVNLCSPVMVASSPTSNFSYQADHERPIPNIEPPPLSPSTAANAKLRKIPGILHRRTSIGEEFEKAIKGEVEEYDEGCKSEDSPIVMASSLGLNHIRTRSSPSPLQFSSNANAPSNLRNAMSNVMDGEEGRLPKCAIPHHYALSREQGRKAQSQSKSIRVPCAANQGLGDHHGAFTKEILSPRFQAILRVTSGRKKKGADIKSFSHELNSKGVKSYPFWRSRAFGHMEDFMTVIKEKFGRLKEEVNCDLGIFAGDLVGILEKTAKSHPHWKESLEDLLIVARQCAKMSPSEFWLKCEVIVQNLDDRRQELSMGTLKQAHTRLLFILSRCTRLVQFQKESGYEEDRISGLHRRSDLGIYSEQIFGALNQKNLSSLNEKGADAKKNTKLYQSEENKLSDQSLNVGIDGQEIDTARSVDSTASSYRMSSWKKLPSAAEKNHRKDIDALDATSEDKLNMLLVKDEVNIGINDNAENLDTAVCPPDSKASQRQDVSWDLCATEHQVVCESYMICRICEVKIPTVHVEEHSKICTIADRCDLKGLTVNQRLERVAEVLERILESWSAKNTPKSADGGEENFEIARVSTSSIHEELNGCSPKQYSSSCPYSEDMIDCAPEVDTTLVMDDLNVLREISRETSSILAPELGKKTSSGGSLTPKSPLLTPLTSQLELLLHGQRSISEHENYQQISRLLDIARLVASVNANDYSALEYMLERLEDLKYTMQDRKVDALVVETFGRRIEKLLQDKYVQLCGQIEDEKADSANPADDDSWVEEDHTLRASPMNLSTKDRTSIEDFEIIKPISRGAFGRVFLARKRATGDLFAIKVLKKADMVRKNAVESILAERNILISARNPFVVRFFYSFTCRENLYLVMEYLNGGDLYSLLRNLGCLDEDMARVYVAEIVLALEYLHSLNVIHRDLKPDNLLISHDGHLKLTDFGLSRVGLINSTDDFSGPSVGSSGLLVDDKPKPQHLLKREHRQKHSVVGTPDYLAPEILLGMGHGATADWWSLGVILYELLVGIPPFNAEHPQQIFDNIMNQDISWPKIPEEMSHEAHDVLNKLLTANPVQRLGATGATEVKQHPFFKDINWGTLARQKAMFIPSAEGPYDTSYFMSRYVWNPDNDHIEGGSDFDDMTETGSATCSSSAFSNFPDEDGDECGSLADFCAPTLAAKYSFSNFSFKNLSQLASINYDLVVKNAQTSPETSRPEFL